MLRSRVLVAAIGLPLLAGLLLLPERPYSAILTLLLAIAAFEFVRAITLPGDHLPGVAAAAVTALLVAFTRSESALPDWMLPAMLVLALVGVLRPLQTGHELKRPVGAWWMTGVLYVATLGVYFVLLRSAEDGVAWLVVVIAATFATDTGAYAAGRLIGRRLLAPAISPGKTWEGAAGGIAAGGATTVAAVLLLGLPPEPWQLSLLAGWLPVAAIGGDLLESAIKRRLGIKDFSQWLPGHGGLLDRLDSLFFVGASVYWFTRWFEM